MLSCQEADFKQQITETLINSKRIILINQNKRNKITSSRNVNALFRNIKNTLKQERTLIQLNICIIVTKGATCVTQKRYIPCLIRKYRPNRVSNENIRDQVCIYPKTNICITILTDNIESRNITYWQRTYYLQIYFYWILLGFCI